MTEYRVDLAHLEDVTKHIESLNAFVADSLTEIDERIATVQSNWSGAAADAHARAHADWIAAAQKIHNGLQDLRAAAAAARKEYDAATAANLSLLGRRAGAAQ
ncbi:WXG100 family type VII secretion target [Nocardia beijingensis]|uniref:WXG100 family type VII secretion target n=1 Tax=Nocardia beijingensis TaxID=95162 RepID=UPI00189593A6|nr:WXG100 family type VII secretion target [Nocardia beijingensis]MBF6076442.1 WXG100 family type VII secretion target [Nocardia beijingensis]